jgi:hypothetical protein
MNTFYEDDAFSALVVGPGVFEVGQSDVPSFVAEQPMILPQWFEREMVRLWTTAPRNNVVNDSLISEWLSIAKTFTTAMNDKTQKIYTYNGQMGLGKSQAAQVACAVLAAMYFNFRFTTINRSWGAILVVELQTQADEAAKTINAVYQHLTGNTDSPAIAKHSNNGVSFAEINEYPILVICHQAYANSLQRLNDGQESTIRSFTRWRGGERRLVVVDESINPITEYTLTAQDCQTVMGWLISAGIGHQLQLDYPLEWSVIQKVSALLHQLSSQAETDTLETSQLFNEILDAAPTVNLQGLYDTLMLNVEWDRAINRSTNARDRRDKSSVVKQFLRAIDRFLCEWSFYYRKGERGTVNSASWLIPDSVGSIVILDGTSDQDEIYELFGEWLVRHKSNQSLRNYSNVTLHIRHETAGLGKSALEKPGTSEQRAIDLYEWLKSNLTPERKVLVCAHMALEADLADVAKADAYFAAFHVTHWGRTTGLNDWRDCDVAVSASCNYRDPAWASSALMTSIGVTKGLEELKKRQQRGLVQQLINSKVAVDCLQMLFRTRIRQVSDSSGGCLPTDLYILLPKDSSKNPDGRGADIRRRIIAELPGATIKEWSFDRFTKMGRRKSKDTILRETAVLRYLESLPPGRTPKQDLMDQCQITPDVWKKSLVNKLSDSRYDLCQRMSQLGIEMVTVGHGRASKVFFERSPETAPK